MPSETAADVLRAELSCKWRPPMKKILLHPYTISSVVFLLIVLAGGRYLFWSMDQYLQLLVVYLMVTIGIRLDEISKKIGLYRSRRPNPSHETENITALLAEIEQTLQSIQASLHSISTKLDE